MHATEALAEADRLMTICNSCRYCEGLCAVFPAMELRRTFEDGDLEYLANLCHNCGACYTDCQFSPPHEFNVNVPQVLARVRADSYQSYAWPTALQPMFDNNGVKITIVTIVSVAGFILGLTLLNDPGALFEGGNFYRVMPHAVMASLFIAVTCFTLLAFVMGFRRFWKQSGGMAELAGVAPSVAQALWDALTLRYLDGGGKDCYNEQDRPKDRRRMFHHLTFYGFMLCFAATLSGSAFDYILDMPAPYEWFELPKLLGVVGGVALSIGALGLLRAKLTRDPALLDTPRLGMDTSFILALLTTGVSGLLLMLLRTTPLMGIMLALHLGIVFALFLTMPYSKFVHGIYRFGALVRYAAERRQVLAPAGLTAGKGETT